jgi:fucose 4-O-acetylase-like acetyltransferase
VRIDALKFFAVSLVVLGHVIALPAYGGRLEPVFRVIDVVNMPLFMFLAGFVLFGREGVSARHFLGRKFLALMVPYFAWLIFGLVRFQPPSEWMPQMAAAVINPHDPSRLWFLYVLFVFYLIFTVVRKVGPQDRWLVAAALLTVAMAALPDGDYFGRANIQWLFMFFVAGYLVAKHRARLQPLRGWMPLVAVGIFVSLWVLDASPLFTIARGEEYWRFVYLAWRVATAMVGIAASGLLCAFIDPRYLRWQAFAGRRSMGIYVTQGWLLVLATGGGVLGALGSWVLILYTALGVALLLEMWAPTRVVLLGLRSGRS